MSTGLDVFDTTTEKTNAILIKIEEELGWQGRRHQSYSALRTVLHALRDRLRMEDATNFSAQLPLLLKGVFFDEWKPEAVPIKMNQQEFLQRIADEFPMSVEGGIDQMTRVILKIIFDSMDRGEVIKIEKALPPDIAGYIREAESKK